MAPSSNTLRTLYHLATGKKWSGDLDRLVVRSYLRSMLLPLAGIAFSLALLGLIPIFRLQNNELGVGIAYFSAALSGLSGVLLVWRFMHRVSRGGFRAAIRPNADAGLQLGLEADTLTG